MADSATKYKKGKKPGPGRPPGTPNKITKELKTMILEALDRAGGVEYLMARANDSPAAFMSLVGKVLPLQVTGESGGPLQVNIIRFGDGHAPK